MSGALALYEVIRHHGLCPFCEHAEAIDTEWDVDCGAFGKTFERPKMICAKFRVRQGLEKEVEEWLLKALARRE